VGGSAGRNKRDINMSKVWNGEGMSQDDFMKKDECILIDQNDRVIGNASKYDAHVFNKKYVRIFFLCGPRANFLKINVAPWYATQSIFCVFV
jgi:hypothetical protein